MLSREQLLSQFRDRVHHPATAKELLQLLRIPREERATVRRHLKLLVESGDLIKIRGNRFGLADRMDLVVGRLQTHPRGFGFVTPDTGRGDAQPDVYVSSANLKEALHGDRVVLRIERHQADRMEGRVIRILERANASVVGRFDLDDSGLGFVVPFDKRLLTDVQVPPADAGNATPGTMVVAELARWPTPSRPALGRIVEVLGPIDAPGVDTQIIIRKHNIPDVHGDEAIEEARRLGTVVHERDLRGRTDFRPVPTVTIDGEHARDFDDAITLDVLPNGHYWLGVHIADVSHYVEEGSALDQEAYERGTSVYFPNAQCTCFPRSSRPVSAR